MNKKMWIVSVVAPVILFSANGIFAQEGKMIEKQGMDMAAMDKSPHHVLMMAHHHSAVAFARVLRDVTQGGKFADTEIARNAFAEIKHCMDQMESIHRTHMNHMSPEMAAKMKPMMAEMKPRMNAEKVAVNGHIAALEIAFQMDAPDAALIQKHAAELLLVLEKMTPPAKKMDMSGKKPM